MAQMFDPNHSGKVGGNPVRGGASGQPHYLIISCLIVLILVIGWYVYKQNQAQKEGKRGLFNQIGYGTKRVVKTVF